MLFIRTALVIGAIVLVLPTEEKSQARLLETATAAVARVGSTCERHPDLCAKAGVYWGVFKQKAEFGARLAMDLVKERAFGVATERGGERAQTPAVAAPTVPRGTLTSKDVEPGWRGKVQRTGA
jgi:hypothetical protein